MRSLENLLARERLSPSERSRARKFAAACHAVLGSDEMAIATLVDLLRDDPTFEDTNLWLYEGDPPDPYMVGLFAQAALRWRSPNEWDRAIRAARLRKTDRLNAVMRSALLPGWGQRYQGYEGRAQVFSVTTLYSLVIVAAAPSGITVSVSAALWGLNILDAALCGPNIAGVYTGPAVR